MAIGCYTEPYLPASYKLQAFKAIEAKSTHGRRGAEGEFAFGETTAYADLGRKIRRYNISARFDGNDHVVQSGLLIAAVELKGPGVLIHPTRGIILSAACTELVVRDEVEEGQGVTYLDMTFVEANDWPNGLSLVGQILGLVLKPFLTEARASFTTNYAPLEIQEFRQANVVAAAQTQISNISTSYAQATTDIASESNRNRVIYDLNVIATTQDQAQDTATADRAISLGMAAIAQQISGGDKFAAFRDLANSAAIESSFSAPASDAENAIYSLVRLSAAAYMAEGIVESTEYRTGEIFEQADAVDAVLEQEQAYARTTCQNALYIAITEFRTEVATQLAVKAYDSPGLIEYNFGGQVSPLKAAYAIHGDATRHRELETMNVVGAYGRIGNSVVALGVA